MSTDPSYGPSLPMSEATVLRQAYDAELQQVQVAHEAEIARIRAECDALVKMASLERKVG